MSSVPMVLNIFLDDLCRHLIAHCARKIPILPKLSSPQLSSQLGKLPKEPTSRNAFQNPHNLGNGILGRKVQEQMHRVLGHFHLCNLKPKLLSDFPKQLCATLANVFPRNPLAVFGSPNQMIFRIVDGMAGQLVRHATMLTQFPHCFDQFGGIVSASPWFSSKDCSDFENSD